MVSEEKIFSYIFFFRKITLHVHQSNKAIQSKVILKVEDYTINISVKKINISNETAVIVNFPKVLVIPRKRWLRPNMTENCLPGR